MNVARFLILIKRPYFSLYKQFEEFFEFQEKGIELFS
jgi:hypothetical protein